MTIHHQYIDETTRESIAERERKFQNLGVILREFNAEAPLTPQAIEQGIELFERNSSAHFNHADSEGPKSKVMVSQPATESQSGFMVRSASNQGKDIGALIKAQRRQEQIQKNSAKRNRKKTEDKISPQNNDTAVINATPTVKLSESITEPLTEILELVESKAEQDTAAINTIPTVELSESIPEPLEETWELVADSIVKSEEAALSEQEETDELLSIGQKISLSGVSGESSTDDDLYGDVNPTHELALQEEETLEKELVQQAALDEYQEKLEVNRLADYLIHGVDRFLDDKTLMAEYETEIEKESDKDEPLTDEQWAALEVRADRLRGVENKELNGPEDIEGEEQAALEEAELLQSADKEDSEIKNPSAGKVRGLSGSGGMHGADMMLPLLLKLLLPLLKELLEQIQNSRGRGHNAGIILAAEDIISQIEASSYSGFGIISDIEDLLIRAASLSGVDSNTISEIEKILALIRRLSFADGKNVGPAFSSGASSGNMSTQKGQTSPSHSAEEAKEEAGVIEEEILNIHEPPEETKTLENHFVGRSEMSNEISAVHRDHKIRSATQTDAIGMIAELSGEIKALESSLAGQSEMPDEISAAHKAHRIQAAAATEIAEMVAESFGEIEAIESGLASQSMVSNNKIQPVMATGLTEMVAESFGEIEAIESGLAAQSMVPNNKIQPIMATGLTEMVAESFGEIAAVESHHAGQSEVPDKTGTAHKAHRIQTAAATEIAEMAAESFDEIKALESHHAGQSEVPDKTGTAHKAHRIQTAAATEIAEMTAESFDEIKALESHRAGQSEVPDKTGTAHKAHRIQTAAATEIAEMAAESFDEIKALESHRTGQSEVPDKTGTAHKAHRIQTAAATEIAEMVAESFDEIKALESHRTGQSEVPDKTGTAHKAHRIQTAAATEIAEMAAESFDEIKALESHHAGQSLVPDTTGVAHKQNENQFAIQGPATEVAENPLYKWRLEQDLIKWNMDQVSDEEDSKLAPPGVFIEPPGESSTNEVENPLYEWMLKQEAKVEETRNKAIAAGDKYKKEVGFNKFAETMDFLSQLDELEDMSEEEFKASESKFELEATRKEAIAAGDKYKEEVGFNKFAETMDFLSQLDELEDMSEEEFKASESKFELEATRKEAIAAGDKYKKEVGFNKFAETMDFLSQLDELEDMSEEEFKASESKFELEATRKEAIAAGDKYKKEVGFNKFAETMDFLSQLDELEDMSEEEFKASELKFELEATRKEAIAKGDKYKEEVGFNKFAETMDFLSQTDELEDISEDEAEHEFLLKKNASTLEELTTLDQFLDKELLKEEYKIETEDEFANSPAIKRLRGLFKPPEVTQRAVKGTGEELTGINKGLMSSDLSTESSTDDELDDDLLDELSADFFFDEPGIKEQEETRLEDYIMGKKAREALGRDNSQHYSFTAGMEDFSEEEDIIEESSEDELDDDLLDELSADLFFDELGIKEQEETRLEDYIMGKKAREALGRDNSQHYSFTAGMEDFSEEEDIIEESSEDELDDYLLNELSADLFSDQPDIKELEETELEDYSMGEKTREALKRGNKQYYSIAGTEDFSETDELALINEELNFADLSGESSTEEEDFEEEFLLPPLKPISDQTVKDEIARMRAEFEASNASNIEEDPFIEDDTDETSSLPDFIPLDQDDMQEEARIRNYMEIDEKIRLLRQRMWKNEELTENRLKNIRRNIEGMRRKNDEEKERKVYFSAPDVSGKYVEKAEKELENLHRHLKRIKGKLSEIAD